MLENYSQKAALTKARDDHLDMVAENIIVYMQEVDHPELPDILQASTFHLQLLHTCKMFLLQMGLFTPQPRVS